MSDPVLLIIIGLVVLLGPALILRMPADLQWVRGPQEDIEPDTGELPELLRRPPRPRPRRGRTSYKHQDHMEVLSGRADVVGRSSTRVVGIEAERVAPRTASTTA